MPALPFCKIQLKAQKPLHFSRSGSYPKSLETWGDNLKTQRLNLQLPLTETARRIGTSACSLINWEKNRTTPSFKFLPKIIEFLGYTPENLIPKTFGERLVFGRRLMSLSQEKLARKLGIDPGTLSKWERGKAQPSKKFFKIIEDFLSISSTT